MSRSNGPAVPPGGVSTRPPRQLSQPLPHQPQAAPVSDQLSQHAFRQPQQAYAPQFDPYQAQQPAPYAAPPQQQAYSNPQAYESAQPPLSQPATYVPQPYTQPAAPAPRAQVPAYDQWTAPAQPQSQPQDPRGYDLGGYSAPPQGGYQQPSNDWGQQQHYGHQGQEPSLDASAYHPDQQAYQQQHGTDPNAEYGEEEGYEDEPAPRGRFLRIAAALAGAIVVGGGLAYAYTSLVTPGNGSPPVIKSASGPSKIKPADAGGKKFANAEKKLMGQLNDGASPGDTDLSGVKKVGTLQVGADGSIMPPAEKPAEAPQTAEADFPGAGATLASTPSPAPANVAQAIATQADAPVTVTPPKTLDKAVQVAAATPEPVKTVVSNTTTNSINAVASATRPAAGLATPPVKKIAAIAAPAAATAVATPPAVKKPAAAPVTAAPTGAGYVAVLASVPVSTTSRINALKQFADMQQKFGPVLQNKTPDVKEANLGDKGNYHRLLVGPPSSREGAQALCGSLKTAGYTSDCWVTAY